MIDFDFNSPTPKTDIFGTPTKDIFARPVADIFNTPIKEPQAPSQGQKELGGVVTLRMTPKAKKRLLYLHAKTGKRKQTIFKELLDRSSLAFHSDSLGGHNSKASFNVVLSHEQHKRLLEAALIHSVPLCAVVSALLLDKGGTV